MFLSGQILNRLLIVWCQSVTGVFAGISVYTHTSACSGCHKLALRFLVPPRKWNRKADEAEQWPFIPMVKTAIVLLKHTQCTVKGAQRSEIHLAKI